MSFPVLFKNSVVSQSIMKNLPCLDFAHNEAVFLNAAVIRVQQRKRIGFCHFQLSYAQKRDEK